MSTPDITSTSTDSRPLTSKGRRLDDQRSRADSADPAMGPVHSTTGTSLDHGPVHVPPVLPPRSTDENNSRFKLAYREDSKDPTKKQLYSLLLEEYHTPGVNGTDEVGSEDIGRRNSVSSSSLCSVDSSATLPLNGNNKQDSPIKHSPINVSSEPNRKRAYTSSNCSTYHPKKKFLRGFQEETAAAAKQNIVTSSEIHQTRGVDINNANTSVASISNGHTRVPSAMGITAVSPLTSASTAVGLHNSAQERFTPPDNSSPSLPGHSPKTSTSPHVHVSPLAGDPHASTTSSGSPPSLGAGSIPAMNGLHPSSLSSAYYSMISPRLQHTTSSRVASVSPRNSATSPQYTNPSPHNSNPSPHPSNPSPHTSNPSPHHSNPSPHQSASNTPRPIPAAPSVAPSLAPSLDPTSPVIPRSLRMRNVIESLMSADVIRRHLEEDSSSISDPPRHSTAQPSTATPPSSSSAPQHQLPAQAYTQTSDVPGYQKALDAVFAKRSQAQHRASIAGQTGSASNAVQPPQPRRNSHDVSLENRFKSTSANGFKERYADSKLAKQSSRSPTDHQMALHAQNSKQYANHSPLHQQQHQLQQQHQHQSQNSPQQPNILHASQYHSSVNHLNSQPPNHHQVHSSQSLHQPSQQPSHHPSQPLPHHQLLPHHPSQPQHHQPSQPSPHNQSIHAQPPTSLSQPSKSNTSVQYPNQQAPHQQQQLLAQQRGSQLNPQQHHQIWVQQQLLMQQNEAVRNAERQQKFTANSAANNHSRGNVSDVYCRAGYDSSPTNNYAIPYDQLHCPQPANNPSQYHHPHDTVPSVVRRSPPSDNAVPPPLIVVKGEIPLDLSMKPTGGNQNNPTATSTSGNNSATTSTSSSPPSTSSSTATLSSSSSINSSNTSSSRVPETSPSLLAAYQNAPKPQQFSGNQQMEQNLASAKYRALYAQPKLSKNEQKVIKMPTTLAEPLSRVSSGGNSFLGDYPANDILFLRCRMCGLTYGSQHSIRKHFAKTHNREPTADQVSVQSISATKRAMSERAVTANQSGANTTTTTTTSTSSAQPAKQPARYIDPNSYVSEYAIEYGGTDAIAAAMAMTAKISKGKLAVRASTAANSKLKKSQSNSNDTSTTASTPPSNNAGNDEKSSNSSSKSSVDGNKGGDLDSDKSMMRCLQCGKDFPTRDWGVFRRHVRAHDAPSATATFRCTVCPAAFSDAGSRRAHMSTAHRLTTCSCKVCDIGFTHIGALRKHLRTVHVAAAPGSVDVEYRCLYCPRSFSAQSDLETHTNRHEYDDAEMNQDNRASGLLANASCSGPLSEHSTKTLLNTASTDERPSSSSSAMDKGFLAKIRQSPPPDSSCNDVGLLKKHLLAETKKTASPTLQALVSAPTSTAPTSNISVASTANVSSSTMAVPAVAVSSSSSSPMTVKLDESELQAKDIDDKCKNSQLGRRPVNAREIIDTLVKVELTGSIPESFNTKSSTQTSSTAPPAETNDIEPPKDNKEKTAEEIKAEKKLEAKRKTDLWFAKLSRDRGKKNTSNGVHRPLEKGVFTSEMISKATSANTDNTVSKDAKIVCESKNGLDSSPSMSKANNNSATKKLMDWDSDDDDEPSTSAFGKKKKKPFRDLHSTLCTDHACESNYLRNDLDEGQDHQHSHHHHHHQPQHNHDNIATNNNTSRASGSTSSPSTSSAKTATKRLNFTEISGPSMPKYKAFDFASALRCSDDTRSSPKNGVAISTSSLNKKTDLPKAVIRHLDPKRTTTT